MQDQAAAAPAYDLGHYLRPVGRHRSVLVFAMIAGLVLGAVYTLAKGKTYTSTVALLVNTAPALPGQTTSVNPANGRTNGSINLDTEGQLVKSSTVLDLAVNALHNGSTVSGLRSRLDIVVPPNSTILHISCKGGSPTAAQACARAVGNAYLTNRENTEKAVIARATTATKAQIAANDKLLAADAQAIINSPQASPARNNAYAHQAHDTTIANSLSSDLAQLQSSDTTPGIIISPAGRGVASKMGLIIGPIAGLILGLIAGLIAVFARERRDKRVRNADDLLRYGVPLIATSEPARGGPRDAATERATRTRFEQRIASVVAGAFDDDGGVIYIAPVSPAQSPDRIARRLASTLASVGHSVELVRADDVTTARDGGPAARPAPRPATAAPSLFEAPGSGSSLGWPGSSADADKEEPTHAPTDSRAPLMDDSFATDPAPMSIPQLIADSRRHAQFVIIEGEPAATDAQAYILTGLSDAALLIVDPHVTTREDLAEVVDQISVTGSELLGAVMWRLNRKQRPLDSGADDASVQSEGGTTRRRPNDGPSTSPRAADAAR